MLLKTCLAPNIQLQQCAVSNQHYEKIHLRYGRCRAPRGVRAKDRDDPAVNNSSPNGGARSRRGCSCCRHQSCYEKRISSGRDSIANWNTASRLINSVAYFFFAKSSSGVPGEDLTRTSLAPKNDIHDTGKFVLLSKGPAPDAPRRV